MANLDLNEPLAYIDGQVVNTQQFYFANGGIAEVYLGEWTRDVGGEVVKSVVAIKIFTGMHVEVDRREIWLKRLKREIINWRVIQHPNVVPFYGVSNDKVIKSSPSPGLVSPYYKNGTIKSYLKANAGNSDISGQANRLSLVKDIAAGISCLHNFQVRDEVRIIVHGDLKPDNVLINDNGRAAICDFGQSRIIDEHGYTTKLAGSARYMAPELLDPGDEQEAELRAEQAGDEPLPPMTRRLCAQSDVYAFGLTALEIASDSVPFKHLNNFAVIHRVVKGETPKRQAYNNVSDGLWGVLEPCWATDKDARPTMLRIAERLQPLA